MIKSFPLPAFESSFREVNGKYFITSTNGDKSITLELDKDAWDTFNSPE